MLPTFKIGEKLVPRFNVVPSHRVSIVWAKWQLRQFFKTLCGLFLNLVIFSTTTDGHFVHFRHWDTPKTWGTSIRV
jgi:hypothetical protein